MAQKTYVWSWKNIFFLSFIAISVLLYGNSLFVWKQTTILITKDNYNYDSEDDQQSIEENINNEMNNNNDSNKLYDMHELDQDIDMHELDDMHNSEHIDDMQENYNLYTNPYSNIGTSIYLKNVKQEDYSEFSECLFSMTKKTRNGEYRHGECKLSKSIKFKIKDVIGRGNHGIIFSTQIEYRSNQISLPLLDIDINKLNTMLFAMKFSDHNETCLTLQFEYNIMKQIQSKNNMKQYHLTNLHKLIPWISWMENNRFTRVEEKRCILIMEQIENVKTFEGVIRKSYPPSFKYDDGLLSFIINCYNDLMMALNRLWIFNYFHIDINGVNILVWPRKNITNKRECYLIDYGGMFAMNFDAKTKKEFTGKSHNYSPFAYYNLYLYELREKASNWNLTKLNYFGRMDNKYRIIAELVRFYMEYAKLEMNTSFTSSEFEYIINAKSKQDEIIHILPGINPNDQTYIQKIWCLRQIQIDNIRKSNLGSNLKNANAKNEFFKMMDFLENAPMETNAINEKLCNDIISK